MRRQQLQQHRNKNRVFGQRTVNTNIMNREFRELLKRFPPLEEFPITKSPGQLPLEDDVLVAIPMGKKYYVWYTGDEGTDDACYLLELNGQRRIVSAKRVDQQNGTGKVEYSYGSVFWPPRKTRFSSSKMSIISRDARWRPCLMGRVSATFTNS